MRLSSMLRHRLRTILSRGKVERELDEELRYHLERQIEEFVAAGMKHEEARYAALRDIGGIDQRKEECRDMRGLSWIENLVQDFRYAIRQLRKSPGFALTAIFVLALGISAAVSIFGLVEAALIRPLPYREQSRLVGVFQSWPGSPRGSLSLLDFSDWRSLNTVFRSLDAYALNGGFTLTSAAGAEPVTGTRVSAGFFGSLGVIPVLGRDFRRDEGSPAASPAVMMSYGAWQKRFGGHEDILGQAVTLNGIPRTIIGVLPRDFHFAPYGAAEFWGTLRSTDPCEQNRGCQNLNAIARLKDGISIQTASEEMDRVARHVHAQYPGSNRDASGATLVPLRDVVVGEARPILLILLAGAVVLMLIACVNVTTLLLARSDSRRREIAVRGSLGATAARLFHQFAMEGLVLAAAGGAFALVFAGWGMQVLAGLVPAQKMERLPYLRDVGLNLHTVTFAAALSVAAGVLFAIIPAVRMSLAETMEGLKEGARGSAGMTWRRFGASLVIVEVALAMVLMTGAGLLAKSLHALLHIDTGMTAEHLASVGLHWPPARYASDAEKVALGRRIVERVSALPGVTAAAISLTSPLGTAWSTTSFHIAGRPNDGKTHDVLRREVSAGYFRTLRARLIRGRYFRETEDASAPRVAIVNRSLANKYFPGEDAIGKEIYQDWAPQLTMEVVGIIDDIKEAQLESASPPVLYVPFDQRPVAWFAVLIRTTNEQSVQRAVPETIHQIDRDISVHRVVTMTERINDSPAAFLHRSSAWLAGSFAGAALLLGVVGLYGVVAYSVSHRTREIGVRMALGARPAAVYRLVVGEAARLVGAGTIIGIGGSIAAATLLRGLFYGVRAWDVPMLAMVAAVLILAALLASYIPARRAASLNPVQALRFE